MTETKYEENSAPQIATSYPNNNPTLTLTQHGLVGTPRQIAMPDRDARSRCQIAMPDRDVRSRCQIAMPDRDVRSRCQIAIPDRDTRSRCQIAIPDRDVRSRCQIAMPDRDARSRCQAAITSKALTYEDITTPDACDNQRSALRYR